MTFYYPMDSGHCTNYMIEKFKIIIWEIGVVELEPRLQ